MDRRPSTNAEEEVDRNIRSANSNDPRARSQIGYQPWIKACQCDERKRVIANLANVMVALRVAPELRDAFAYDEMDCAVKVVKPLPSCQKVEQWIAPRELRDADAVQVQEWLQNCGLPKIGIATVHDAIDLRARESGFHPVLEYLESLTWDRKPRIGDWLSTYLGAGSSDYSRMIGRLFLISMVARIFKPGCKVDYALVLEGEQGLMKSSVCDILAGRWFSDSLPDIMHKDANQHLRGKWLIEIAELSSISKAEAAHLKAFITRKDERYRPAYGRKEVHEPRQCVFIGTTNESIYLKDHTGGRRFWPVTVGQIDLAGLREARDQIFAEAVHEFKSGAQWWPSSAFEKKHIAPEQSIRQEVDAWAEPIEAYLETVVSTASRDRKIASVTVGEVGKNALGIETSRLGKVDQIRIAALLQQAGWQRSSTKIRGAFPYRQSLGAGQ